MSEPLADAAEPREDRGGGVGEGLLLLIVGLAGAATMVVELGAVRVLAPWFGTSSSVCQPFFLELLERRYSSRHCSATVQPELGTPALE